MRGACGICTAATACNTGAGRWSGLATIVLPDSGCLLQHEWDCGMLAEPHICAMRLQHARSCAVMCCPGSTHASSGAEAQRSMTLTKTMAAERRINRL